MLAEGIVRLGIERLPWTKAAARNGATGSCSCAATEGEEWPDLSDAALAAHRRRLARARALRQDARSRELSERRLRAGAASVAAVGVAPPARRRGADAISARRRVQRCRSTTRRSEGPTLAIRVQELFGLDRHPTVADGRVPLVIELLSPAHRPVQVTRDLPGFWRGSYAAVKAEMRGRYPRHPWPDDPLAAMPTRRAKPRSS